LQPFGQGREACAAEHDIGLLEAGKRQTEVREAAVEDLAGDGEDRPHR